MAETRPGLYIGTMGWTYKDWVGTFYPHDTDQKDFLGCYSQIFSGLEIDSTFYFIPKPAVVSSWYAKTPPDFRFTAKVPREITHEKVLLDCEERIETFVVTMALLGPKLGCLLVQLPPSFRYNKGTYDRVGRFLDLLPTSDFRFAVEFRHRSWVQSEVFDLLRSHQVAWTIQDHPWFMPVHPELTADFTYIRWLGDNDDSRITSVREVVVDRAQDIIKWSERLKRDILPRVDTFFGFFNNHYAGHAPTNCNQMKRLLGLDTVNPDIDRQMSLF